MCELFGLSITEPFRVRYSLHAFAEHGRLGEFLPCRNMASSNRDNFLWSCWFWMCPQAFATAISLLAGRCDGEPNAKWYFSIAQVTGTMKLGQVKKNALTVAELVDLPEMTAESRGETRPRSMCCIVRGVGW